MPPPQLPKITLEENRSLLIINADPLKYLFDFQTNKYTIINYTSKGNRESSLLTPPQKHHAQELITQYLNNNPDDPDYRTIDYFLDRITRISDTQLEQKIFDYKHTQLLDYMRIQARHVELIFPEKEI